MSRNLFWCTAVAVLLANPPGALAANDTGPQSINEQISQLQQSNARLEQRLQQDEDAAVQAPARGSAPPSSVNSFNPAISMVLSGTYEQLQRDPAIPVTGFAMSANNTGYTRGFSLQESELGIAADIDPLFRGVGTFSLAPEGGIAWRMPSCRPVRSATA